MQVESPILGAVEAGKGRIAVYGDSNCLDSSHMVSNCYWLLKKLLDYTSSNIEDPVIFPATNELVGSPLGSIDDPLPQRRDDVNFSAYSLVLQHPLRCGLDSPVAVQGSRGYISEYSNAHRNILQPNPIAGGHLPSGNTSLDSAGSEQLKGNFTGDSSIMSDASSNVSTSETDRITEFVFPTQTVPIADDESVFEVKPAETTYGRVKNTSQVPLGWWTRDEVSPLPHSSTLLLDYQTI